MSLAIPICPELQPLYPPHCRELSARVRFERAGGRRQGCGRPHHLAQRWITYRRRYALGGLFLGRYERARPCPTAQALSSRGMAA